MLARQQRRRHHDGDLQAGHGGNEGGTQRHLRLAEADVAADQAIHGPAGGEVLEHGLDAGGLILRLLVGEARDELVVGARRRGQRGRLLQLAQGGDLDQLGGDLAQALLQARLARSASRRRRAGRAARRSRRSRSATGARCSRQAG